MDYLKASRTYDVPKSTLEMRVKNKNKVVQSEQKGQGPKKPVLSGHLKESVMKYIFESELKFHGLSMTVLRKLAFQLAKKNNIATPFNAENEMAGIDWARSLLRRHGGISLRKPELTSAARARGFNPVIIDKLFDEFKSLQERHNFPPNRIFNADETGVSTVP